MRELSWQAQIHQALLAIDHRGESSPAAQHWPNGQLDQADIGVSSYETFDLVLARALTFTDWLVGVYPEVRRFADVDQHMTAEILDEKLATCPQATLWTWVVSLRRLQTGLYGKNWIVVDIVPAHVSKAHHPSTARGTFFGGSVSRGAVGHGSVTRVWSGAAPYLVQWCADR